MAIPSRSTAHGTPAEPGSGPETSLRHYLKDFGLLLCNENRYLPSLGDVGGDWPSIVNLMEQREAFHCKVFRNRTTYLSQELYFLMKPYRQRLERLPDDSRRIYDFLLRFGSADTSTLKRVMGLPVKTYTACFDLLLQEMLITVTGRDRELAPNWSSFRWGTWQAWEKGVASPPSPTEGRLRELLLGSLEGKVIDRWLKSGGG